MRLSTRAAGTLTVDTAALRIVANGRKGAEVRLEAAWKDLGELRALLEGLAPERASGRLPRRILVLLGPGLVQSRNLIGLPPASRRAIAAIATQHQNRHFRVTTGQLVVAVPPRPPGATWIGFAADEALLDALAQSLEAAGFVVEGMRPVAEPARGRAELIPPALRSSRVRCRRLRARTLLTMSAGLWLVLVTHLYLEARREAVAVERAMDSLRAPLAALDTLQAQIHEAAVMLEAVDRMEATRGTIARQLLELTRSLPDSSALTTVVLSDDRSGRLVGLARRPLDFVAELERRGTVAAPQLEGGSLREHHRGVDWERFTVAFGARAQ
jgi:hypothetical protein